MCVRAEPDVLWLCKSRYILQGQTGVRDGAAGRVDGNTDDNAYDNDGLIQLASWPSLLAAQEEPMGKLW